MQGRWVEIPIIVRTFLQNDTRKGILRSRPLDRNWNSEADAAVHHEWRLEAHRHCRFGQIRPPYDTKKEQGARGEQGEHDEGD